MRHTAGMSADAAGLEVREVMAIMGHSTFQAALMYKHKRDDYRSKFANNVAALDPTYSSE